MAKVFGPCLSISAKGSIKKTITFQKRPSGMSAIRPPVPGKKRTKNPTAGQAAHRADIAARVAAWQSSGEIIREYWEAVARASGRNLSGYHEFIRAAGIPQIAFSELIADCPLQKNGLVGYWAMDGVGANAAVDFSGNGNGGILSPSFPANCPAQVAARSVALDRTLFFDGVDDYVGCSSLESSESFSLSVWANRASDPAIDNESYFYSSNNQLRFSFLRAHLSLKNNVRLKKADGSFASYDLSDANNLNEWIHLTTVYDGENDILKGYRNGVLQATHENVDIFQNFGGTINIGRNASNNWYFDGLIDDVRVYDRVLSPVEILQLYDLTKN